MSDLILSCIYDFPFYALLALSFTVSFRVLNFPDLAVDSAYALGMALMVALVTNITVPFPLVLALGIGIPCGFIIGACTASLHGTGWMRLSKLLSGLIVSFAMYSVNFRLNGNTSTTGLYSAFHEFNSLRNLLANYPPQTHRLVIFALCFLCLLIAVAVTAYLFRKGLGANLRVAGYRPNMVIETGGNPLLFLIIGLGLADTMAVLSGVLRAAADNYADINTFGMFLYALASLMLGERIIAATTWGRRNRHRLRVQLMVPIVGGLTMSILIQMSIWGLGTFMNVYMSSDIRLVIAAVLVVTGANSKMAGNEKRSSNGFW